MKKNYSLFLTVILLSIFGNNNSTQAQTFMDSVILGPNYQNQSYFNFPTKEVKNINNSDWEVAFQLTKFSIGADIYHPKGASILINGANGVELYTIPNSNNFTTADSSNFSNKNSNSVWKKMHNTDTSFNDGAFNRNKTPNPFDFGWGNYGFFANNHNVTGDSVFLIKTRNGQYKKLFIDSLKAGVWYYRFANVNNSNLVVQSISKYSFDTTKLFAYLDLENANLLNPEPVNDSWDLLFSKFTSTKDGKTNPNISVLNNELMGTTVGVDNENSFPNAQEPNIYSSNINTIGDKWNNCNVTDTNANCTIERSKVYFVKTIKNGTYKFQLISTNQKTGSIVFIYEYFKGNITGLNGNNEDLRTVDIYPNPSNGAFKIAMKNATKENYQLEIYSATGSKVKALDLSGVDLINGFNVDLTGLSNGLYTLNINNGKQIFSRKFALQN